MANLRSGRGTYSTEQLGLEDPIDFGYDNPNYTPGQDINLPPNDFPQGPPGAPPQMPVPTDTGPGGRGQPMGDGQYQPPQAAPRDYAKLQAWRDAGSREQTDELIFNDPEFQRWSPGQPMGGEGSRGGNTPASNDPFKQNVQNSLQGLFQSGGGFNQDIVNRRTDVARDTLERQRKSRVASNDAALANRGLLGAPGAPSGVEGSSLRRLDTDIADQFANQYSNIYADESENADARMMQALQIGAGMSAEDARNAISWFKAQSDDRLGMGNLALGNMNGVNNYNLGVGRLGLDRDKVLIDSENADVDQLIRLIEQLYGGAKTSAGGYVNG